MASASMYCEEARFDSFGSKWPVKGKGAKKCTPKKVRQ